MTGAPEKRKQRKEKSGKEKNVSGFQESGKNPQTACLKFEGLMAFRCVQRLCIFKGA